MPDQAPFVDPDDAEEERDEFQHLAESKGWKCRMCTNTILLEDKEAFQLSGMCSKCHHKSETE